MAVGKITVPWLLCGILSWLFASPAFAATVDVTMSNLTFRLPQVTIRAAACRAPKLVCWD